LRVKLAVQCFVLAVVDRVINETFVYDKISLTSVLYLSRLHNYNSFVKSTVLPKT